jgi:hypothetical protein
MSEASCILAKSKNGGEAVTRRKYKVKLVAERISGEPVISDFTSAHLDRGREQEPLARMAYEAHCGLLAIEVPFLKHPTIAWVGASLDGEVDTDGTVEIKCVMPHIQVDTILSGGVPPEHVAQIQGGLWVTGRQFCDFISYSPTLPGNLSLCVYRVMRDEKYIAMLEAEVLQFLAETATLEQQLRERAAC